MKARIQKWGNSLAMRIPKSYAREVGIEDDTLVDIVVEEDKLIITPVPTPQFTLEQLLAGITADNLHSEEDTGAAVGAEVW